MIGRNLPLAAARFSWPCNDDEGTDPGHHHQRGHSRRFR
jgi:hypothetical protein